MKKIPPSKIRRHRNPKTTPRPPKLKRLTAKGKSGNGADGPIVTISASDLQTEEFPPLRYAVDGYLAEGLTLLAGKPKIGKSWMALDFAMAVATGDVALGSVKCRQGPVLYCALEDNHRRLQRRMRQLYGAVDHWPPGLHFATQVRRLSDGLVDDLRDWIEAHRPKLVIIDTFAGVRPQNRREGYDADYAALSPLQELAGQKGIAILVIHHLRKMLGDDPFDMISGTTGLTGAVDTAFVLHRGKQGVTLYGRGREIEEMEQAVEFVGGMWKMLGDAAEVRRSEERSTILEILEGSDDPMGPKEIADALGWKVDNVKQLLFKMHKDGEIKKKGRGQYCVADEV
ncbi:AAA family ATPase [Paracoccus alkenifer]|uniref:RecA-family ATPase n=1 Tax=Paracoccus alkenifer TaxID=65735 RepID=A0A1H6K3Q3_9RHOB|nr:AAA family ATPase [Paracoccus alkenifer]SEH69632.1 RecA-family ATPase [Paracoccus alkenifer]